MNRDFELIKTIMLEVKKRPANKGTFSINLPDEDKDIVLEHCALLVTKELLDGRVDKLADGKIVNVRIFNITWFGFDFIDALSDDTIWQKAKDTVLKPGVSFTFDLLFEYLKSEAKAKLGLSSNPESG